jgi:hypothetical protein
MEEILKLKGRAVKAFLKYDSRKLIAKEQKRIKFNSTKNSVLCNL